MLARWYLLLGQFSVTFEYRPGHSTRTRMGCLANVASASVLNVRCRRWIRRFRTLSRRQRWWISLSPHQKWASRWMQTYCRSCPVKLIEEFKVDLLRRGVTWTLLQHPAKMRRWRRYGSGFSQNPLWHGRSVLSSLRSYAVGGCKWAICPSTRMAGYGGAGRRRRRARNWSSPE